MGAAWMDVQSSASERMRCKAAHGGDCVPDTAPCPPRSGSAVLTPGVDSWGRILEEPS